MKAAIILFDATATVSQLHALNDLFHDAILTITGSKESTVTFMNDKDVAEAFVKEAKSAKSSNKKTNVQIDPVEAACEYVHHLYCEDVLRKPSEEIEKDIIYHMCKIDNNHSANLRNACEVIYNNQAKALVFFTDRHAGTLLESIRNAINLIKGMNR